MHHAGSVGVFGCEICATCNDCPVVVDSLVRGINWGTRAACITADLCERIRLALFGGDTEEILVGTNE